MNVSPPTMRKLAQRLLTAGPVASGQLVPAAVIVSEKLRVALSKFAGVEGFVSLLRRAVALAGAELPELRSVEIGVDGRLEGLERVAAGKTDAEREQWDSAAALAITAHLLVLLDTFVGPLLTLKLIRDAWPNTPFDDELSRIEPDP